MSNEESDLFSIKVNEKGARYIRKFSRICVATFIFMILMAVSNVIINAKYIIREYADLTGWWQGKLYSVLLLASTLINFVAVLYYVRFAWSLKSSLETNDEIKFNQSFGLILRNAVLFLLVLILNLFIFSMSLTSMFGGWS